jgi:hypothetical protein
MGGRMIPIHDVCELVGAVGTLVTVVTSALRLESRLRKLERTTEAQNPTLEWQTRALAQVCERTRTIPPPGPRPKLMTLTDPEEEKP